METTEFIIRENGTITERIIRERALDAEASVLNALTEEVTQPLRDVEGDESGCQAIFAVNETHSSEAYYCRRTWRRTERDPRVYYPELNTERAGDPAQPQWAARARRRRTTVN
jgi:hypothetical protein